MDEIREIPRKYGLALCVYNKEQIKRTEKKLQRAFKTHEKKKLKRGTQQDRENFKEHLFRILINGLDVSFSRNANKIFHIENLETFFKQNQTEKYLKLFTLHIGNFILLGYNSIDLEARPLAENQEVVQFKKDYLWKMYQTNPEFKECFKRLLTTKERLEFAFQSSDTKIKTQQLLDSKQREMEQAIYDGPVLKQIKQEIMDYLDELITQKMQFPFIRNFKEVDPDAKIK